ncbi:hypothetical protein SEUCBS139899_008750 [Sporothrix eucalyptigena]
MSSGDRTPIPLSSDGGAHIQSSSFSGGGAPSIPPSPSSDGGALIPSSSDGGAPLAQPNNHSQASTPIGSLHRLLSSPNGNFNPLTVDETDVSLLLNICEGIIATEQYQEWARQANRCTSCRSPMVDQTIVDQLALHEALENDLISNPDEPRTQPCRCPRCRVVIDLCSTSPVSSPLCSEHAAEEAAASAEQRSIMDELAEAEILFGAYDVERGIFSTGRLQEMSQEAASAEQRSLMDELAQAEVVFGVYDVQRGTFSAGRQEAVIREASQEAASAGEIIDELALAEDTFGAYDFEQQEEAPQEPSQEEFSAILDEAQRQARLEQLRAEHLTLERHIAQRNRQANYMQIMAKEWQICKRCQYRDKYNGGSSPLSRRSGQVASALDDFNAKYEAAPAMVGMSNGNPNQGTLQDPWVTTPAEPAYFRPPVPFDLASHVNRPNYEPSRPSKVWGPLEEEDNEKEDPSKK